MSSAEAAKRSAIFVGIAVLPFLIWYVRDLILLVTGAVVLSGLLQLASEPLLRWTPLPRPAALVISTFVVAAIVAWTVYLFGSQASADIGDVLSRAAAGLGTIHSFMEHSKLGRFVLSSSQPVLSISGMITPAITMSLQAIEVALVVVISAIYIAAQPDVYRRGLVKLFPPRLHPWARLTLDEISSVLRLWLIGQLIQMVLIGLLSFVAVWLIGLPSPLTLGVIAGVCEFIPYVGPVLAAIPALLVAITVSDSATLWTLGAYVLIHQTEGHLIIPLVQRYLIFIPPAALLLGLAGVTLFFGSFGLIFAAPIVVILFASLRKIYYRDMLDEDTVLATDKN